MDTHTYLAIALVWETAAVFRSCCLPEFSHCLSLCASCQCSCSLLVALVCCSDFSVQATVKGSVIVRRKRGFRITPDAMVCKAPTMDADYIERVRQATLERYASQATKAAELKSLQDKLFTAHASAVEAAGDQGAGGSSSRDGQQDADCVAVDLDNLSAIASRRGKITATTQRANMAVLRAAFKHRTEGKSHVSAKILAAAGESGGLPVLPDAGPCQGRGGLEANEGDGGTPPGALKQLQRRLCAQHVAQGFPVAVFGSVPTAAPRPRWECSRPPGGQRGCRLPR